MANPNLTGWVAVPAGDGSTVRLQGDYGCLAIEASAALTPERWEAVKAEGDRLLAVAQAAEAERLEGIASLADDGEG